MARPKRAAAGSGAQKTRAHLQDSSLPQARTTAARSKTTRQITKSSKIDQCRDISSSVRVKEEPAEDVTVSMSKEVESEQEVVAALAQTVHDRGKDEAKPTASKKRKTTAAKDTAVKVKEEDGAESEVVAKGQGRRGKSKIAKAAANIAVKAEPDYGADVPLKHRESQKLAEKLQGPDAAAEDVPEAKPKMKRQRKAKAEQDIKAEMPAIDAQQDIRKKAAAAPRRRKSAKRVEIGKLPL